MADSIDLGLLTPENGCPYTDVDDLGILNRRSLNFLHLNIHSLNKNADNLKSLLDDLHFKKKDVDVVMLCETFLTETNKSSGHVDGYESHHAYRTGKTGGGVSILIRDGAIFKKTVFSYVGECTEALLIEVEINCTTYVIGSLYRIPNTDVHQFLEDTRLIFSKIGRYTNVIIGADQNLDFLKLSQHRGTSKFFEQLSEFQLVPTINKPARVMHLTSSLIDNIYLKCKLTQAFQSFVIYDGMSDYFPCLLTLLNKDCYEDKFIEVRHITEESVLKVNQRLLFADWSPMDSLDVNDVSVFLIDKITYALNEEVLKRVKKINY